MYWGIIIAPNDKKMINSEHNSGQTERLKRLLYRSWHRGCKETDIVLGQFADAELGRLSTPVLDTFEQLLEEQDADIWAWLTGKSMPGEYATLIDMMKPYAIPRL